MRSLSASAPSAVAFSLLALAASPSHAGPKYVEFITKSVNEQCLPNAQQLTSRENLAPVFGPHPVDAQKVCDCATKEFMSDPKLLEIFNGDDAKVNDRIKVEPAMAYVSTRLTTSIFKCIVPAMDESLSGVSLK
ncbi:hypothetical protein BH09PSE6_BH09PSE6_13000 [soil metagenome]